MSASWQAFRSVQHSPARWHPELVAAASSSSSGWLWRRWDWASGTPRSAHPLDILGFQTSLWNGYRLKRWVGPAISTAKLEWQIRWRRQVLLSKSAYLALLFPGSQLHFIVTLLHQLQSQLLVDFRQCLIQAQRATPQIANYCDRTACLWQNHLDCSYAVTDSLLWLNSYWCLKAYSSLKVVFMKPTLFSFSSRLPVKINFRNQTSNPRQSSPSILFFKCQHINLTGCR